MFRAYSANTRLAPARATTTRGVVRGLLRSAIVAGSRGNDGPPTATEEASLRANSLPTNESRCAVHTLRPRSSAAHFQCGFGCSSVRRLTVSGWLGIVFARYCARVCSPQFFSRVVFINCECSLSCVSRATGPCSPEGARGLLLVGFFVVLLPLGFYLGC